MEYKDPYPCASAIAIFIDSKFARARKFLGNDFGPLPSSETRNDFHLAGARFMR